MTYKLFKSVSGYECVIRLEDVCFIPFDPQNRDYAEYLKWLAEGNVPLSADSE